MSTQQNFFEREGRNVSGKPIVSSLFFVLLAGLSGLNRCFSAEESRWLFKKGSAHTKKDGKVFDGSEFLQPGYVDMKSAKWFKGNLHTHCKKSDGNWPPEEVIEKYKSLGYHFLAFTDHNNCWDVSKFNTDPNFLVIPGEEITHDHYPHINAINIKTTISAQKPDIDEEKLSEKLREENPQYKLESYDRLKDLILEIERKADVVRKCANETHKQGGIAVANHPRVFDVYRFSWFFDHRVMLKVKDLEFFEVWTGSPYSFDGKANMYVVGDEYLPGTEKIWDEVLSNDKLIYGIAADDSHQRTAPDGKLDIARAWIVVRAQKLTTKNIIESLKKGDFYCSNGLEIKGLKFSKKEIYIKIKPLSNQTCKISFIGKNGFEFKEVKGWNSSYNLKGNEMYIRIKARSSNNRVLLTQPYFTKD